MVVKTECIRVHADFADYLRGLTADLQKGGQNVSMVDASKLISEMNARPRIVIVKPGDKETLKPFFNLF